MDCTVLAAYLDEAEKIASLGKATSTAVSTASRLPAAGASSTVKAAPAAGVPKALGPARPAKPAGVSVTANMAKPNPRRVTGVNPPAKNVAMGATNAAKLPAPYVPQMRFV